MPLLFRKGGGGGAGVYEPAQPAVWIPSMGGWETRSGWANFHDSDPLQSYSKFGTHGRYSNVLNETISWTVWLGAGSYKVDFVFFKSTHYGRGRFEVDGVQVFDTDQSATGDNAQGYVSNVGAFTIASSGMHTLTYRCLDQAGANTVDTKYIDLAQMILRGGRVGIFPFPALGAAVRPSSSGWLGNGQSYGGQTLRATGASAPTAGSFATGGDGALSGLAGFPLTFYRGAPGASGAYIESDVWLDAGTYAFDIEAIVGTTQGVGQLTLDGTAVGTPQAAGTLRQFAATTAPGNGNKAGAALSTGEVDHYDSCGGTPIGSANAMETGLGIQAAIPNALTGIVVGTSGWKAVRYTCVGKNTSSLNYSLGISGQFRRTA